MTSAPGVKIFSILLLVFFYSVKSYSQQYSNVITVTDTLRINLNNEYNLNSVTIIPFSEKILLQNKLLKQNEYEISYERSQFKLSDSLVYSIFDTLFVTYRTIKLHLKKEYKRRELIVAYNTELKDSILLSRSALSTLSPESIFGENIQKSGTLIRGFTVGTTKDFNLSSGLRLQLSGNLSKEIEIVAALTDENTPIQPEGNSERLEELDKVFIQIKHKNAVGTFGDYELVGDGTEFGRLKRKLQGLKGELMLGGHKAQAAIASSRGKFNSNEFAGLDGVQGPYRLTGINNENDIIIIAGSERVYLDGEILSRGDNNDYTIEYGNAEVTFTPNRLITSASRIYVDFEYADRQFKRNFFGAGYNSSLLDDRLKINLNFYKEGDDKDSPIDITISDEERKILEQAGDNVLKAVTSGVTLVEPDSNGIRKGLYEQKFELSAGDTTFYYLYNPGGANAVYNVVFTHVGAGKGNYSRESVGNYKYVGDGYGAYLPVKLLPMPQQKQFANIRIGIEPLKDLIVDIEFAGSDWDRNRFSNLDSGDDLGYARNINIGMKQKEISINGVNFGKAGFSYRDRFIENRFTSLDRIDEVEFNRYYNITSKAKENELLREFKLNLVPVDELKISSLYGRLEKGNGFYSNRYSVDAAFNNAEKIGAKYNLDYVSSNSAITNTRWLRQDGKAFYTFGKFQPGIKFLSEDKQSFGANKDSLSSLSLKYLEIGPYLNLTDFGGLGITANLTYREESFPVNGIMEKESEAVTHGYKLKYSGIREVTSNIDFIFRSKKYTNVFKRTGSLDNETILIRSQNRLNFFRSFFNADIYYEAATEKTAKMQKVFVRVPQGTGNYKYLGDLNGNGVADENEFEPTVYEGDFVRLSIPTDELFPVINLKANTRFKLEFSKIIKGNSLFDKIIKSVSTESVLRVEENSAEEDLKKIYLLNFSRFLNDSTTLRGSNLTQHDIHIFRNKSDLSFRFRFLQRRNLNKFNNGSERGFYKERAVRIRFRLVKEIGNQTEYSNITDFVQAPANSNRSRQISGNEISSDFSYRPINNLEIGFKIKVGRNKDDYPAVPTIVDINSQSLRAVYSIAGKGRLRAEIERSEFSTNTLENYIPFEILRGNSIGKNYFWRLNFDYRFTENLQSTLSYDGRVQGAGKVIHTMRAEARAYF